MNKKIILTESEKNRILGMHKYAVHSEKKILNEVTLADIQGVLIQRGFLPATSSTGKKSDDNRLGPNTLAALKQALSPSSQESSNTAATTSNTAATTSNTATTTPSTASTVTNTGSPVKYPWIGADGRSSLTSLQNAKTSDPNFNNWLGELKKLNLQQLTKVQQDLRNFENEISQSGIKVGSDESYLVANQAINDAMNMVSKSAGTQ